MPRRTREHRAARKMRVETKKFGTANWLTVTRLLLMIPFIIIMCVSFSLLRTGKTVDDIDASTFYYYIENSKPILAGSYYKLHISILYWINLIIFIAAMITDFVDGHVARKTKTISAFGKIFDPIADKVATSLMLIYLTILNYTFLPIVILFIIRDIIVDGCRVYAIKKDIEIKANIWGKIKTIIVSFSIVAIAIAGPWVYNVLTINEENNQRIWHSTYLIYTNIPLIIGLLIAWISGIIYMKKYLKGITNELVNKHEMLNAENAMIDETKANKKAETSAEIKKEETQENVVSETSEDNSKE
ncbi:CDP-diacylglycerol--glycerol-3-phosphate 3-phosphatidyltransferase [Metamycoplasma cloacale]|uniref:CDP-diacylglycerol--glycerol-3-phosphate 3-phosphatidyltransferase n=1 Tax=Metamycoplasma cloacale TaxID=92401 RepID=A0A2Z4LM75_9BACT|nr:CDP-diacylglycerol--glycerol-3-phosphate 3-phosphatidyltransferase [Metamycoplasma cloacale]AWX42804.1 CDP-diacylglycerol--glycerol-3-phosphate 3-phosphatidyltransferase [Metamycoplasma cloacale]VEU79377.1 CDP-diacylglycerol--glycerol-3-phosphate 3-phosphatidyltransferase [Metamycoplasma cloacale]